MKLNQVLAIESGVKKQSYTAISDLHKAAQKPELYEGRSRNYKPLNEEGERFPAENQVVQLRSKDVLAKAQLALVELFDVVFTKDLANCTAKANIEVDGKTILSDVPVSYLLFLEKQLSDLETFVGKMPTLSPGEQWTWDPGQNAHRSDLVESAKTKKVIKGAILVEATKEHPAQVQQYSDDVVVGYWSAVKYSGAISALHKEETLARITNLKKSVKFAREAANSVDVSRKQVAGAIFSYLFGA